MLKSVEQDRGAEAVAGGVNKGSSLIVVLFLYCSIKRKIVFLKEVFPPLRMMLRLLVKKCLEERQIHIVV